MHGWRSQRIAIAAATFAVLILAAGGVALSQSERVLPPIGRYLVAEDPLERCEIGVVLAGDYGGDRILKAAELGRRGYARLFLVNGSGTYYGRNEADMAIEFAVANGASRELFEAFPMTAHSTAEEARIVDAELRARRIDKALVVTSSFHTRRASFLFDKHSSQQIAYLFAGAPTDFFQPDRWWLHRESQNLVALEYLKTLRSKLE